MRYIFKIGFWKSMEQGLKNQFLFCFEFKISLECLNAIKILIIKQNKVNKEIRQKRSNSTSREMCCWTLTNQTWIVSRIREKHPLHMEGKRNHMTSSENFLPYLCKISKLTGGIGWLMLASRHCRVWGRRWWSGSHCYQRQLQWEYQLSHTR